MAVSALSLSLDGQGDRRNQSEWCDVIHAALEEGVNTFEIVHPSPALLAGAAAGLSAVSRRLLFVCLRIDPSLEPTELEAWVEATLHGLGLTEINLLAVSADDGMDPAMLVGMRRVKELGRCFGIAIAGDGDKLADRLDVVSFDALITPFNLLSGWRERRLIRTALEAHMGVIGAEPCPEAIAPLVAAATAESKPGLFKRAQPLAGVGTYGFLEKTPNWTCEQLCVGYALTEPAVATAMVKPGGRKHVAAVAGVTERDLPAAVSAQIEMARFSAEQAARDAQPQARRA
ncbi:MAG TPA: aldo/keto reductase [Caulobacteraceae bacterium]|jgi:aryl-alcohol dehydrogenase-like predicted oxidoreductase